MARAPLSPRALEAARTVLRWEPDSHIRKPLWIWIPEIRPLILHERRRRFGIEEERIDVTTLTDEEDA